MGDQVVPFQMKPLPTTPGPVPPTATQKVVVGHETSPSPFGEVSTTWGADHWSEGTVVVVVVGAAAVVVVVVGAAWALGRAVPPHAAETRARRTAVTPTPTRTISCQREPAARVSQGDEQS